MRPSDTTGKPRIRGMVLDARRERPSSTPLVVGLTSLARGRPARPGSAPGPRAEPFGALLVESERYEILLEHLEAHAPTSSRVERGRGVDVAIVIAGQKNFIASRDLKLLHACGCRRALLLVPPDVPEVVVENLGRYLLLGARFDADEMPVHQLARDPEELTVDDAAALVDAIDRCALPVAAGSFLARVAVSGSQMLVTVARGALAPGADAFAHAQGINGAWRHNEIVWSAHDEVISAGDDVYLPSNFAASQGMAGAILAHEPLTFIDGFDLAGTFRSDDVAEMCFAFGGNGGYSEGRIHQGRVSLSEHIAPFDNRVGLVRFQGAGLGPVQSIELGGARHVVAPPDPDETPDVPYEDDDTSEEDDAR